MTEADDQRFDVLVDLRRSMSALGQVRDILLVDGAELSILETED